MGNTTEQTADGANQRIEWIDTARGIGIFLVILGHISMADYGFLSPANWIYSFHMPLFFFLSGVTHKNAGIRQTLRKSARQLLVPYVFFYAVTWAWWFVVSVVRHPELYPDMLHDEVAKPFAGMLLAVGYATDISEMANGPLWFCAGLFWCKVFFSLVENCAGSARKKYAQYLLCAVLLVTAFLLNRSGIPLFVSETVGKYTIKRAVRFIPFSLGTVPLSYIFFFAGTQFKKRAVNQIQRTPQPFSMTKKILLILLCLFCGAVISVFNGQVSINSILFGNDLFLYILGALCGIGCIYGVSTVFHHRFCSFMGKNSLVVLACHSITTGLIGAVIKRIFSISLDISPENPLGLLPAFLLAVCSFLLCAVPAYIISRWFPWALGRSRRTNR